MPNAALGQNVIVRGHHSHATCAKKNRSPKVLVHGDLCGPVNIMAGNRRLQADILHSAHRKCDDETHVPLSIHPVSSTCFLKVRQVFLRRASVAGTSTLPASNHAVD